MTNFPKTPEMFLAISALATALSPSHAFYTLLRALLVCYIHNISFFKYELCTSVK